MADDERPNILLVFVDDMGWSDLGCYGGQVAETPRLDRFAAEGLRFTDAYAAMPNCTPSRACLITGQTSPRHGIYTVSPAPAKVDEARAYEATQRKQRLIGVRNRHEVPDAVATLPEVLSAAGYHTGFTGKWHHSPRPEELGFDEAIRPKRDRADPKHLFGLTRAAIEFIEGRKGDDRPWFFYLSHHAPHVGVESLPETLAKYEARLPADSPVSPGYAAMIEDTDAAFGQLMDALDASGQAERTLVVFTSDNGGFLRETSNAPLRAGKSTFYEGGIRVPMLVRWPGMVRPGSLDATPVSSLDLLPTFADLAAAMIPAEQPRDGVSLLPLLSGDRDPALDRDALYWHFPHYNLPYGQAPCSVIRRGDHKLIYFYEDARTELYNLRADPGEQHDLAEKEPARRDELHRQLDAWIDEVDGFRPRLRSGREQRPEAAVPTEASSLDDRPNLIVVLADDLSAGVLSCYGGESVETPVLDQLAAEGMRYTHCYSPSLCMPSRCELLTGKYSHRNFLGRGNVAVGEATIASELRKAGYATCQLEKWHLNINGGAMPMDVGFDEYYHTRLAQNYADPVVDANGEEQTFPGGYGPQVCQDFAFDFIERHRDQPFFLYYAIHLPHAPYHVPPGSDLAAGAANDERYFAMVEHMDERMGQLVAHLDALELRERTLLLFLGDNGTPKGFHYRSAGQTLEGGKASLLDSGTHVPMIVSWPGTAPAGVVTESLVDFADFLPTSLDLAGIPIKGSLEFDGRSFHRQLLGDSDAPTREFSFKFGVQNGGKGAGPSNGYWARTQRWKLYDDGRFYDLPSDRDETSPLPVGEAGADGEAIRARLQRALDQSGAAEATQRWRQAERAPAK